MPLAHLVDPFKQVKLIVPEEGVEVDGGATGSDGEMQGEADGGDMREIEVRRETEHTANTDSGINSDLRGCLVTRTL